MIIGIILSIVAIYLVAKIVSMQRKKIDLAWYIKESKFKESKLKKIDIEHYTKVIDEKQNIRRNSVYSEKLVDKLIDKVDTLVEVIKNSAERYPNNPCLGTRHPKKEKRTSETHDPKKDAKVEHLSYDWETYSEVWNLVKYFGKGLVEIGHKPGDFVGVYSKNRREWLISLYGSYSQSMVNVAIYDTFGPEVLGYCCEDAKIGVIVAEKSNLQKILSACEKKKIEVLKQIIVIDTYHEEIEKKFANIGIKLYSFEKIIEIGKENDEKHELNLPKPDTLATVMYTSGSTGDPKGVMLNHSNVVATVSSVLLTLEIPGTGPIGTGDVYISYLPLAHIFERVCCAAMLFVGARIGFYSGDNKKLLEDLSDLKPTLMAVVPKVLSNMKEKMEKKLEKESKFKQLIFKKGYEMQQSAVKKGKRSFIWDLIVFNKIKNILGGNVRLLVSGGAPLTEELWEFAKVAFGCPVLQGYALTEIAAAGTIMNDDDNKLTAGTIVPSIEIKLKDWEEGGQTLEKNKSGEIWIRGPSVFVGYYNKEEKTKEDLDSDGWFHTGDIGHFTKRGLLKIVDRKKNIFKLANGEYIPAEKIEKTFMKSDLISQILIHGESTKDHLIAVVVPKETELLEWCKQNDKKFSNVEEFFSDKELSEAYEKFVFEDLNKVAKTDNLKPIEIPKKIIFSPTPWNPENDLTTPTMKIKREALEKKFEEQIKNAYEKKENLKSK